MKILLSIKPQFVKEIVSARKKFEYRKRICNKEIDGVVVYSSMPEGLIVGEFTIDHIECENPEV